jgi:Anti-sigma-D factor RsdA to sigma factor binding region
MSETFGQPDLHEVARSARFLDALANREPVDFAADDEAGYRELAGLLEDWRDELRGREARELCTEQDAAAVLDRGLAGRRRSRRRMTLVTAAAAVVVGVAAFGAVLGQVKPGDALYGVRETLFGEPASVHDDKIALSAEADLDQVEQMIALGQWDQAHDKLAAVGAHVQTVKDSGRKQGLIEKVNRLNATVVLRSGHVPSATDTTPGAPVITMAPNPFGG